MKKTLIIAVCLLLSNFTKAQYTITSVYPEALIQGDTMTVSFIYNYVPGINQLNLSPLPAGYKPGQAWELFPDSFHLLPKYLLGNDTTYKIKKVIPDWFSSGKALVSQDWKTGIEITIGTVTGLKENTLTNYNNSTYFDLNGNQIEKRNFEVIIEQSANQRKKIIIIN